VTVDEEAQAQGDRVPGDLGREVPVPDHGTVTMMVSDVALVRIHCVTLRIKQDAINSRHIKAVNGNKERPTAPRCG